MTQKARRNPSIYFSPIIALYFVYFIDIIAITILFPIGASIVLNPEFGKFITGSSLHLRAFYLGILTASFALGQLVSRPFFLLLVKKFNRKPLLMFSILALSLGCVLFNFSLRINSYMLLIFSRIFTGFAAGSNLLCFLPSYRVSSNPNLLHAYQYKLLQINGSALIIGSVLGGIFSDSHLSSNFNYEFPLWITALFGLIIFLYLFLLKKKAFLIEDKHNLYYLRGAQKLFPEFKKEDTLKTLLFFSFLISWLLTLLFLSFSFITLFSLSHLSISLTLVGMGIAYLLGLLLFAPAVYRTMGRLSSVFGLAGLSFFAFLIYTSTLPPLLILFHIGLSLFAGITWGMRSIKASIQDSNKLFSISDKKNSLMLLAAFITPFIGGAIGFYSPQSLYLVVFIFAFSAFSLSIFIKNKELS